MDATEAKAKISELAEKRKSAEAELMSYWKGTEPRQWDPKKLIQLKADAQTARNEFFVAFKALEEVRTDANPVH
jgi:hypothetical protein